MNDNTMVTIVIATITQNGFDGVSVGALVLAGLLPGIVASPAVPFVRLVGPVATPRFASSLSKSKFARSIEESVFVFFIIALFVYEAPIELDAPDGFPVRPSL